MTVRRVIPPEKREIYDGKTLNDVFQEVVQNTGEERALAIDLFRKLAKDISDITEFAIVGESLSRLLDVAAKSTDNLVKMTQVAQRHVDKKDAEEEFRFGLTMTERNELFDILETNQVGPQRLIGRQDPIEKTDEEIEAEYEEIEDDDLVKRMTGKDNTEDFLSHFPNEIAKNSVKVPRSGKKKSQPPQTT